MCHNSVEESNRYAKTSIILTEETVLLMRRRLCKTKTPFCMIPFVNVANGQYIGGNDNDDDTPQGQNDKGNIEEVEN